MRTSATIMHFNSPPHRRLRNSVAVSSSAPAYSPPHRRLRNIASLTTDAADDSPPHRRLRNTDYELNQVVT